MDNILLIKIKALGRVVEDSGHDSHFTIMQVLVTGTPLNPVRIFLLV